MRYDRHETPVTLIGISIAAGIAAILSVFAQRLEKVELAI
jgi:hypothetical protein